MSAAHGTLAQAANPDAVEFAKLDVMDRLAQIEANLKQADPQLPQHMTAIHKTLLQHEELVHILPDDRIHVLMEGMQKYKQLQIVEAAVKKPSSRGKKISEDDF